MLFSIKCKCGATAHWNKDMSVYSCEDCDTIVDPCADDDNSN